MCAEHLLRGPAHTCPCHSHVCRSFPLRSPVPSFPTQPTVLLGLLLPSSRKVWSTPATPLPLPPGGPFAPSLLLSPAAQDPLSMSGLLGSAVGSGHGRWELGFQLRPPLAMVLDRSLSLSERQSPCVQSRGFENSHVRGVREAKGRWPPVPCFVLPATAHVRAPNLAVQCCVQTGIFTFGRGWDGILFFGTLGFIHVCVALGYFFPLLCVSPLHERTTDDLSIPVLMDICFFSPRLWKLQTMLPLYIYVCTHMPIYLII